MAIADTLPGTRYTVRDGATQIEADFPEGLIQYDAPFLREKLLIERVVSSDEEFREAFDELKRYFVLLDRYGPNLAMTSRLVDDVWHQFILFTRHYHSFCQRFFGRYVHHEPALPSAPLGDGDADAFYNAYAETFGPLAPVWLSPSAVNEIALGADCRAGGCRGGGGCKGCASCKGDAAPENLLAASCKGCNGGGGCHGCNGCKG